ncbi:hypothetical protein [Roseateles puraquae]|uniref:hypothetical protein n=1 Tax=Roseateles puraquae TaxID=431059 RepID=UPI0031E22488
MRSNCLFWACAMWWRLRKPHRRRGPRERQFSWRGSRWGCFPHFGVMVACRDGRFRFISYKPYNPRHKVLPPPVFEGGPRWADWQDTVGNQ